VPTPEHQIRADFDRETIVVYQAYRPEIAEAALAAGRFVAPFSFNRMTWIKPSFLWMMHRSNWGQKSGQERVLAVRIRRTGWEKALGLAVPTWYVARLDPSREAWAERLSASPVRVQWDPERSLRGELQHRSIQIGLSRHVIREFVDDWIVELTDLTPQVRKIYDHIQSGRSDDAKRLLPDERVYPLPSELKHRLLIDDA
jgi:hypothetical protein